ncbi:hypothetical protein L3X38_010089 [Prunus dulcis]|uniref:HAT C-terminal dimerisation domain-containing protein n=1 Tax=Prunus dulcis TaxID=3755 RepID=A0AAD4WGH7_PRUDU|nr:hypothetical protein L3X38_010089 [Prunus dulcis]
MNSRKLRTSANWWKRFGRHTPEWTKFAIRVLSLTCSAHGCETNWNIFEQIHTKKRNILEHQKLNALVYVKYNMGLRERVLEGVDQYDGDANLNDIRAEEWDE